MSDNKGQRPGTSNSGRIKMSDNVKIRKLNDNERGMTDSEKKSDSGWGMSK